MKLLRTSKKLTISLSLVATFALCVQAGDTNIDISYSAKANKIAELEKNVPNNPLKNAYFGETHMHTALSLDALFGMTATGFKLPDDAYRFAKGETLEISGVKHNIGRPLDFAAVSDHAEFIGESYSAMTPSAPGYDSNVQSKILKEK